MFLYLNLLLVLKYASVVVAVGPKQCKHQADVKLFRLRIPAQTQPRTAVHNDHSWPPTHNAFNGNLDPLLSFAPRRMIEQTSKKK